MAQNRDRFSTTTRLRLLGEQTAARVYRSQTRRQARRSRLTGRAALLALVLCTLIVALAYPTRQYVSQRAEIAKLEAERDAARERVEDLRDLKARWKDDAYAEQRIRERLHQLRPGETGFTVRGAASAPRQDAGRPTADRPWYDILWEDVDEADTADGTDRAQAGRATGRADAAR
ncbi:septum formation initiator family protein [Streptomyces sp. NPDC056600]|uniref:FtsB family cell division protein n=1 Tax=Streptomyces sp. NPDC056600 TaxID=3345874 RepID=UPI0036748A45